MAADLGQDPPKGSTDPRDYVTTKIRTYFSKMYGYELESKIAAGSFGKVFKGYHRGDSKSASNSGLGSTGEDIPVAVKMMMLDKLPPVFADKFLKREMDALKKVVHPNAVKVYYIFNTKNRAWIFMEFAPNGNIEDYIVKVRGSALDEPLAGYWMNQIFDALQALHETYKMAHRDLKLENIMLDSKYNAKVTDFGFATLLKLDDYKQPLKVKTWCGTLAFEAPQIINKRPYDPVKADVWACGVMLYNMVTMKMCFGMLTKESEMLQNINQSTHKKRAEYQKLPEDCRQLIDGMLTIEEDKRPNIVICRHSPWAKRLTSRPLDL